MRAFNVALGAMTDLALWPFRASDALAIVVLSVVTSVGVLLVYRAVSDQAAIRHVQSLIHAGVFEIRLHKDDVRMILRAERDIIRHSLTYLRLSLVPVVWVIGPMALLLIQLQFRYGYEGLQPGGRTIVSVTLREDVTAAGRPALALEGSHGLRVETPMIWLPSTREASWRIGVVEEGAQEVVVTAGDRSFTKVVDASEGSAPRSPRKPSARLTDQLLYPVEAPLPRDAPLESITVRYGSRDVSLLGWDTHWLVAYFILTIVFAFALQRPLKVRV